MSYIQSIFHKEYAAISYNGRDKEMIVNYIRNQKEHHKVVGFEEEYRAFFIENGIAIKEEYFSQRLTILRARASATPLFVRPASTPH